MSESNPTRPVLSLRFLVVLGAVVALAALVAVAELRPDRNDPTGESENGDMTESRLVDSDRVPGFSTIPTGISPDAEAVRLVDLLDRAWETGSEAAARTLERRLERQDSSVTGLLADRIRASGDPKVRAGLVRSLGSLRRAESVEVLAALYQEAVPDDPDLAEPILDALTRLGGDVSVEALADLFGGEEDPARRSAILEAVETLGDPRHESLLVVAAGMHASPVVTAEVQETIDVLEAKEIRRREAVLAWQERHARQEAPPEPVDLVEALRSQDIQSRLQAIHALAESGSIEGIRELGDFIRSAELPPEEEHLRTTAMVLLARNPSEEVRAVLMDSLVGAPEPARMAGRTILDLVEGGR